MNVSRETGPPVSGGAENSSLRFRTACLQNGLSVTDTQIAQMARFVNLLLEWNQKVNLISRKSEDDVWQNHILHSISVLFVLELQRGASVLDIGTGGGLPGIPLKILRPDLGITLVDSIHKKISAVEDIIRHLNLVDVKTVTARVEDIPEKKGPRASFDYTMARGVAPMKDLVRWSLPVLKRRNVTSVEKKPGGVLQVTPPALIAFKGGNIENELKQVKELENVRSADAMSLTLKGSEQLIDLEKKVIVVQFSF